ncbi:MAG: DNA primase [Candidatus Moranbacteria bacterium]|nr:DNA primase [Candidatus Moranbacteria bacterium]
MNDLVQKIKERLSIVDVASSYLKLEKAGKNFRTRCPFHNEKTPSFFISPERGSYYCFGCNAKGDIFSFVEHFEGTDFIGALKILAEKAGLPFSLEKGGEKDELHTFYKIMEEATKFFENNLSNNSEATSYLLNRGLNKSSITNFRVGYAKEEWGSLNDYLTKKGFKQKDIENVGLIKQSNAGDRYYDRFRGRIMFPISDSSGRVIAFSGRLFKKLDPNSKIEEAKYINSPDTPLYNKSNVLYGLDKAKNSIRSRDYSIVVEGQMDLILSHQAGFTNTVAVSGTAFTDSTTDNQNNRDANESKINNLGLIKRLSSNIIFAYDGDGAGIRAAYRSAMIALSLDMQVKIAFAPKGKDPADTILESPDKWKSVIKNSTDVIHFLLREICEETTNKEARRKKIEEKIFPFLLIIVSSVKRSNYIKEIYDKTGIQEESLISDFKDYEKRQGHNDFKNEKNKADKMNSRKDSLSKRFFSILFYNGNDEEDKNFIAKTKDELSKSIGQEEFEKMLSLYEPISDNLIFEAEKWYSNNDNNLQKDLEEISLNLEEEILNDQSYALLMKIKEEEKENKKEDLKEDLINYQKIVEKIESIKSRRIK